MKKESISARGKLPQNNHRKDSYNGYFIANNIRLHRQIKLSNNGGTLSSDTGELLIREFDEKIGFSRTLGKYIEIKDDRLYHTYSSEELLH